MTVLFSFRIFVSFSLVLLFSSLCVCQTQYFTTKYVNLTALPTATTAMSHTFSASSFELRALAWRFVSGPRIFCNTSSTPPSRLACNSPSSTSVVYAYAYQQDAKLAWYPLLPTQVNNLAIVATLNDYFGMGKNAVQAATNMANALAIRQRVSTTVLSTGVALAYGDALYSISTFDNSGWSMVSVDFYQLDENTQYPKLSDELLVSPDTHIDATVPPTLQPILIQQSIGVCGAKLIHLSGGMSCNKSIVPYLPFGCGTTDDARSFDIWTYLYTCNWTESGCQPNIFFPTRVNGYFLNSDRSTNPYICSADSPNYFDKLSSAISPLSDSTLIFDYTPGAYNLEPGDELFVGYWSSIMNCSIAGYNPAGQTRASVTLSLCTTPSTSFTSSTSLSASVTPTFSYSSSVSGSISISPSISPTISFTSSPSLSPVPNSTKPSKTRTPTPTPTSTHTSCEKDFKCGNVCSNDQSDCWSNTIEEEDEVSLEFDDLSKDVETVDTQVKDGGKEVRLPIVLNGVKYGEVIFEANSLQKGWTVLITKVDSKTLEKQVQKKKPCNQIGEEGEPASSQLSSVAFTVEVFDENMKKVKKFPSSSIHISLFASAEEGKDGKDGKKVSLAYTEDGDDNWKGVGEKDVKVEKKGKKKNKKDSKKKADTFQVDAKVDHLTSFAVLLGPPLDDGGSACNDVFWIITLSFLGSVLALVGALILASWFGLFDTFIYRYKSMNDVEKYLKKRSSVLSSNNNSTVLSPKSHFGTKYISSSGGWREVAVSEPSVVGYNPPSPPLEFSSS